MEERQSRLQDIPMESPAQAECGQKARRGRYHNDYSPRYKEPYDIYEKARTHMKQVKKGS